jgi:hypothetical protein
MARRADPARIEAAWLEADRQRLLSLGYQPDRVDQLIAAWSAEADQRGLTTGHRADGAWQWLMSQPRR